MSWLNGWLYDVCSWLCAWIMMLFFGLRVTGLRNWPQRGPALLVANHLSFLDPIALGCGRPRRLQFLGRKTLFTHPLFGGLLRRLNCVPIDQEGVGIEGMRTILARLQGGHVVVIFPEGERSHDGKQQPLKPGIALLLKRAQAPVVPVGIVGTFAAWPRWRGYPVPSPIFLPATDRSVAVAFGPPRDSGQLMKMPREELLATLFEDIARQIQRAEEIRRK